MSCCSTSRPMTSTSKRCAPSRMRWWPFRAARWSSRTTAGSSIASQPTYSPSKATRKSTGSKATIRNTSRITRSAKAKTPPNPIESATNHWQGDAMSMYITQHDELHVEYQGIALTCPHCQTVTHLTAVAVPKFDDLNQSKPKHVGIAFRFDACTEP